MFSADGACPLICYNGGECVYTEKEAGFGCSCPSVTNDGLESTFVGQRCETPAIVCKEGAVSYNCLNGSSCNLEKGSCNCPAEFEGTFCKDGPSTCLYGGMCYNGGECNDRHERKKDECKCKFGTEGEQCEIIVTGVRSNPGAIAGIAVGSLFGVVVLAVISRRVYRRCTGGDIETTS